MAAQQKQSIVWQRVKQSIDSVLLTGGHEAEKLSHYIEQDINDLAEIVDYSQTVIKHIVDDDTHYMNNVILHWLGNMTYKMELACLALEIQKNQAGIIMHGDTVVEGTILRCCECEQQKIFPVGGTVSHCESCRCDFFEIMCDQC